MSGSAANRVNKCCQKGSEKFLIEMAGGKGRESLQSSNLQDALMLMQMRDSQWSKRVYRRCNDSKGVDYN